MAWAAAAKKWPRLSQRGVLGSDEPQVCFVDKGGRGQGVAGGFLGEPGGCQLAQLFVHERQQLPRGVGIALGEVGQNLGDFVHRRHRGARTGTQAR